MKYKTLKTIEDIIIKDRSSKFIGYGFCVLNESEVKEKINYIKQKHIKASHYCYAYRIGITKDNFRVFDDGEPNGTAGLPILNQIDSFHLSNTLIVIVRYFGGTKLGVSGLIAAYKSCAKETILRAEIVEKFITQEIVVKLNFTNANLFFEFLQANKIKYSKEFIESDVVFKIDATEEQFIIINNRINLLSI